jgi:lipopolysaccharide/colanic/teichoic acid biosynthesis glycosyltransferase
MQFALKRLADLLIVFVLSPLWIPLLLVVGLLIRVKLGRPILFRQQRPGHRARIFTIYKFRTMSDKRDSAGQLLPDGERLTKFGRWLRSTSLDELPELLNIVRGEMSLVGPRPLLVQYLDRYSPEQARRHDVLPGLTGWSQINGRNALSWPEKLKLDVWYVDHWSVWLDVKILALTLRSVLLRHGISAPGGVTMPEFQGSSPVSQKRK